MFTAAKENEFRKGAEEEGLVPGIKAQSYSKEPRYSIKRRKQMPDSSADERKNEQAVYNMTKCRRGVSQYAGQRHITNQNCVLRTIVRVIFRTTVKNPRSL